jgi:hypothetical protein
MRRARIDPSKSDYVLRSGATRLEYSNPHGVRNVTWTLTWRPVDRRLCATAASSNQCFAPVEPGATRVRATSVSIIQECPEPWVGTQGLIFGVAPEPARRMLIFFSKQNEGAFFRLSTPLSSPPGEPHVHVFVAALDHPLSVTAAALGADGFALPSAAQAHGALPLFRNAC